MVIGIHSRDKDLIVNPIKGKQLTNVRSSGTDEAVRLITPIALTLESAVEFIDDDELVEITPKIIRIRIRIRIRKRYLLEHERKRSIKPSLRGALAAWQSSCLVMDCFVISFLPMTK